MEVLHFRALVLWDWGEVLEFVDVLLILGGLFKVLGMCRNPGVYWSGSYL